jgi:serine/threonine protein kinase
MLDIEHRLRSALAPRYRVERQIGTGGMAIVYLADDLKHSELAISPVLNP